MKTKLAGTAQKLILVSILAFSAVAQANSEPEFISTTPCGFTGVDDFYNSYDYLINDLGQVKIDVTIENSFNSDSLMYDRDTFRTEIIQSLAVQGETIVHTPTGTVCAKFTKPTIIGIGKKSWFATRRCGIKTTEAVSKTYDKDGFATGKACSRSYYFYAKPKK